MAQYKVTLYSDCEFWGENSHLCTGCNSCCTAKDPIMNRLFANKREAISFFKKWKKAGWQIKMEKV